LVKKSDKSLTKMLVFIIQMGRTAKEIVKANI
jgi:hypothetical protein